MACNIKRVILWAFECTALLLQGKTTNGAHKMLEAVGYQNGRFSLFRVL
ncbi:MAG: hypothetical protein KC421_15440 [Anaerolineales bacterium]|nr:hypothetical protein [Anaerolineales bacterium]